MKKILTFGIILLFVSLAFIPCINGNSDVEIIESRNVNSDSRIKEFSIKLLGLKARLNDYNKDDCGCEENNEFRFPVFCKILGYLFWLIVILLSILDFYLGLYGGILFNLLFISAILVRDIYAVFCS